MSNRIAAAAVLLLVLNLCACGSGNSGDLKLEAATGGVTSTGLPLTPDTSGLPAVAELEGQPDAPRNASMLGPGWYDYYPEDYMSGAGSSVESSGATLFSPAGGSAWAIYRLGGFSDDASPTSLHTHVDPAASAPYFVSFPDFKLGRWRTLGPFSGDAMIELPGTDTGDSHPLDFVSASGRFYCAIVDSGADELRMLAMEVGVYGGLDAPQPPTNVLDYNLVDGTAVSWRHSPDYNKPDFAGYTVEARQFLTGQYTPVGQTSDQLANILKVPSAPLADGHRVAALDVSGNRSAWAYTPDGSVIVLDEVTMNVDLKMPRGPLYGPLEVSFDMSGSSSLDGTAISEYKLSFDDPSLNYTGSNPVVTRTLQPGCYLIRAEVNDGSGFGGKTGETLRKLVVYPRWESDDILVRDASDTSIIDRYLQLNGGRDPQSGDYCLLSYNQALHSLCSLRGAPEDLRIDPLPTNSESVVRISDPVFRDGIAYFTVMFATGAPALVTVGPDSSSVLPLNVPYLWMQPVLAAGRVYLVVATPTSIGALGIDVIGAPVPLAAGIGSFEMLDCAVNPLTGNVDIAWSDGGSVNWLVWNTADNTLGDSGSGLLTGVSFGIDIECDPISGDCCILSRDGSNLVYTKQDGGSWTPQAFVDNSGTNYWPADLKYLSGNPYAFATLAPGTVNIYRLDSAGGVLVNTADYTSDGLYSGFFDAEESSGSFLCFDVVANRELNINRLFLDDSESPVAILPSLAGLGYWLDAATGSDALYLQTLDSTNTTVKYLRSTNGLDWTLVDEIGALSYSDLFSTAAGDVFRTTGNSSGYEVSKWDGLSWIGQFNVPGAQTYNPISPSNMNDATTAWLLHDSVANKLERQSYSAGSFTETAVSFPESTNVYGGALAVSFGTGLYPGFVHYSQPALFDSFGLLDPYFGSVQNILTFDDSYVPFSDMGAFRSPLVAGRTMEQQLYRSGIGTSNYKHLAAWSVNGHNGSAFRYTYDPGGSLLFPPTLTDLPLNHAYARSRDFRRTVSAAQARGLTAVSIMANIHGKDAYMEWSNFGDWEQLPLPAGIEAPANAELLIDNEGRWYLFWSDIRTGDVYCRRTL